MAEAIKKTWARGRVLAFYQGLVPWVLFFFPVYNELLLTRIGMVGSFHKRRNFDLDIKRGRVSYQVKVQCLANCKRHLRGHQWRRSPGLPHNGDDNLHENNRGHPE